MIDAILGQLIGAVWPYLLGAGGLAGVWLAARRGGRKAEQEKRASETLKGVHDGQERVNSGKGLDPVDRLRRNDGMWRP